MTLGQKRFHMPVKPVVRFGYRGFAAVLGVSTGLIGGFSVRANAEPSVVVTLPCSDQGTGGMNKCDDLTKQVLDQLKSRVALQFDGSPSATPPIQGYYQGGDPGTKGYFGPTVCSLGGAAPFFGPEGPSTNNKDHNGNSCGTPIDIYVKRHVTTVAGCAVSEPSFTVKINKKGVSDSKQSQGTLEDGHLRGGLVQATTCHFAAVSKQIKDQKSITVQDIGGAPSPCLLLARDLTQKTGAYAKSLDGVKSRLKGQSNIEDIVNCGNKDFKLSSATAKSPDVGPLRQSAQHLCAARAFIEGAYSQLAACEVFARAQVSYRNRIGSSQRQQEIFEMIKNKVSQPAADECKAKLYHGKCHIPSSATISACVNQSYRQHMPEALKAFLESLWPVDGSHCESDARPTHGPSPWDAKRSPFDVDATPLLLGSLAWIRRKRKNSEESPLKTTPITKIMNLAGLTVYAHFMLACSSANMPAIGHPDTDNNCSFTTQQQSCCDSSTSSTTCSVTDPGSGGVAGPLDAGAADINSAGSELSASDALVDPSGLIAQSGPNAPLAQGATASEGGVLNSAKTAPKGASNASITPQGTGGGTRSRTSGPTGGGGGLGFNAAGLKTGAATDETGTGALGAAATEGASNGSAYRSTASAGADGTADGFRPGFGSADGLDAGAGGGGNTDLNFGSPGGGGPDVTTAASTDPEDYFTRLGLGDNLFKVVERRYQKTSIHWVAVPPALKP